MEEVKQKVILIGTAGDVAEMSAAVARLVHSLDVVCVAQLEAKAIEMKCPEVDLPAVPICCCGGPWPFDGIIDSKAMAAALAPLVPPAPPVQMVERERFVGAAQPYRGYMNSRHGRRRNW